MLQWNVSCSRIDIVITENLLVINFTYFLCEGYTPFLARSVFLHSVEKIPSVQSLVETSNRPNIWGAVMALGFILISLCGVPQSVIAFIKTWIQLVLPAPLGPSTIIPWRTRWVSNNCKKFVTWSFLYQRTSVNYQNRAVDTRVEYALVWLKQLTKNYL